MKPVNRNSGDEYVHESQSGVDAVLERMLGVLGNPPGSYAIAFDVPESTIKTWRHRGKVSLRYLEGFAKANGTTIEYLQHGTGPAAVGGSELDETEREMLKVLRSLPEERRRTLMHQATEQGAQYSVEAAPALAGPSWPQVLEWVYDALVARNRRMPNGRKLRELVDAVMVLLQVEQGEQDDANVRRKIEAIL